MARIVVSGVPHHVTQRGNNRQQVFFDEEDRRLYLSLLAAHAERFGLTVLGYCLLDNHMHVVALPEAPDSLARAIGRTDCGRARWGRGDWAAVLAEGQTQAEIHALHRHTDTGQPWGSEAFVARLEDRTGRLPASSSHGVGVADGAVHRPVAGAR